MFLKGFFYQNSENTNTVKYYYNLICNLFHDDSEIILICSFGAQETFLIIYVENMLI